MRYRLVLLLPFLVWAGAAQEPLQTLVERLNLAALKGLTIVSSEGDASTARYQLVSLRGVRPVLGAVERKLLAEGWAVHPNLDGEAGREAPNAGLPNASGRQLRTFVQERELLEVMASPVGRSTLVSLRLNLISLEPSRPVAALPDAVL
jgi:hypothetical protein